MKNYIKAFTLVELIVVITILSILSTIGFISFQGYTISSRDSVRIADIMNMDKGLSILLTQAEQLPYPDDMIEISASGTLLNYQGNAAEKAMSTVSLYGGGIDPLDNTFYTYILSADKTKYQLLGFLERESFSVNNTNITNAADLTDRYPILRGYDLGILLDPITQIPAQNEAIDIDILNTTQEYELLVNDINSTVTGTGNILFSNFNILSDSIKAASSLDQLDSSLVLSLDMETLVEDDGWIKLKDSSGYDNHGLCYTSGVIDCADNIDGIEVIQGKKGKAIKFDNTNSVDYTYHLDSTSLNILTNEVTVSGWMKPAIAIEESLNGYPIFLYKRPWNTGGYAVHFSKSSGGVNIQYCYNAGSNALYYYGGLTVDEWIYYTGVKNNTSSKIYINGILAIEESLNESNIMGSSEGSNLSIGKHFEGSVDEIKVYNRALSAEEVYGLYENDQ